ncbi:MAG: hypothetical protein LBI86_03830 [Treponema sp.]|jgi:hypothetical protein|nr:hypothetical protein [Treponema sp.]
MKSRYCATAAFFLILSAVPLRAQTAAELERLLETREITSAEAAWFTFASTEEVRPPDPALAFALAVKRGLFPKGAAPDKAVTMSGLSLLMMKTFRIEGGLMYRIFPCPRYAFREMTRLGFIESHAYPNRKVSGEQFLYILGILLSRSGDAEPPETAWRPLPEDTRDFNRGEHQGLSAGSEAVQGYGGEFEPE